MVIFSRVMFWLRLSGRMLFFLKWYIFNKVILVFYSIGGKCLITRYVLERIALTEMLLLDVLYLSL